MYRRHGSACQRKGTIMDDEQRQHLESLRRTQVRRLPLLDRWAARNGTNTPPEIEIEIEDLRSAIAALDAQLDLPPAETSPALPQLPQEQRRLVTVFRALINGLADLAAELDPEDMAEILADLRQRGTALITRFNGHADIQTEGQIMAL